MSAVDRLLTLMITVRLLSAFCFANDHRSLGRRHLTLGDRENGSYPVDLDTAVISTILVLLVEDETVNLDIFRAALEDGGYDVVPAENGSSATQILDSRFADFTALVTDIRLGQGPSGWDVARRARELKPEISVIYITGDSSAEWAAQGVPKSLVLQKPFALAQLVTAVSTLLNEASSTPH